MTRSWWTHSWTSSADIITDFQRGLDALGEQVGVVAGDFGADGHLMIVVGDWFDV